MKRFLIVLLTLLSSSVALAQGYDGTTTTTTVNDPHYSTASTTTTTTYHNHDSWFRHNFLTFNRFGLGLGGSFVRTDEVGGKQSVKLDVNAGPLYINYYSKAVIGGGFMPVFPVYKDRVGFGAGVGLAYYRNTDVPFVDHINIMFVHVPAALDFRLAERLHLRGGPSWFITTNAGKDVNGLDRGTLLKEGFKHPRGDISVRYEF